MVWVVIAIFLLAFVGVALAVYSRSGSDISEHPLDEEAAGDAPGAAGPGGTSGQAAETSAFDQHGTR